jgi:hypothetical protein
MIETTNGNPFPTTPMMSMSPPVHVWAAAKSLIAHDAVYMYRVPPLLSVEIFLFHLHVQFKFLCDSRPIRSRTTHPCPPTTYSSLIPQTQPNKHPNHRQPCLNPCHPHCKAMTGRKGTSIPFVNLLTSLASDTIGSHTDNQFHRSGKSYEQSASPTARRSRLPPAETLTRFACDNTRPPLAFREPITAAKSSADAAKIIKDFESKMRKG